MNINTTDTKTEDYNYETAGFDSFLTRSIDSVQQINLDSPIPINNTLRFDSTQISGALGDTMRLGRIFLNGAQGNIILNDGVNDFLLMGDDGQSN